MSNLIEYKFTGEEKNLICKIVSLVLDVQEKGDYCSIEISNYATPLSVHYIKGAWSEDKEYTTFNYYTDLQKSFVEYANECIEFLENVLYPPKEMTIEEIEQELGYKVMIKGA